MKNTIMLGVLLGLVTNHAFAQTLEEDKAHFQASKKVAKISMQEWKDAMAQYKADWTQTEKVTSELGLLQMKTTQYDHELEVLQTSKASYEAGLKDPNDAVRAVAQENIDRLTKKIEADQASKAKAVDAYQQAIDAANGTYKTYTQIENELQAKKETIAAHLAPYKASGDQGDPLVYKFVNQDLKYDGDLKESIHSQAYYDGKKYLQKKYSSNEGLFHSQIDDYYSKRSADAAQAEKTAQAARVAAANQNVKVTLVGQQPTVTSPGSTEKTSAPLNADTIVGKPENKDDVHVILKDQNVSNSTSATDQRPLPPAYVQHKGKTTITQQLVSRGNRKVAADTTVADSKASTDSKTSTDTNTAVATTPAVPAAAAATTLVTTKVASPQQTEKTIVVDPKVASDAAANFSECDQAKVEIVRLLLAKGNPKAFSDMVYLSQLKMAYRISGVKPEVQTVEAYLNQKKLQGAFKDAYKDDTFKISLTKLYDQYGKVNDIEKQNLMVKDQSHYFKARLNNESASAVILYLSQHDDETEMPFTEQDAAAVWAQQKLINDGGFTNKGPGNANYNLLNFSTRVCQMLKDSSCTNSPSGVAFDPAKAKALYAAQDKKLNDSIQAAGAEMVKQHPKCFNQEKCDLSAKPVTLGSTDIESIKGKISELVGKGAIGDGDTKVEVDTTKTKAIGGDLTIYLKH